MIRPRTTDHSLPQATAEQILSNVFSACSREPNSIPLEALTSYSNYRKERYALQRTVELAAAENEYSALPLWQVKKLYHHGGDSPTTVMDWDQPLQAFQGKTAYEMACEGFSKHVSQTRTWYSVARRHERWDSYVYSLTASAVGDDAVGGDLFENIPAECISTYNK